jgi:hypothetical protein
LEDFLSGDIDEALLKQLDYGAQDKVLISIRYAALFL